MSALWVILGIIVLLAFVISHEHADVFCREVGCRNEPRVGSLRPGLEGRRDQLAHTPMRACQ